jgi:hypothetical protein
MNHEFAWKFVSLFRWISFLGKNLNGRMAIKAYFELPVTREVFIFKFVARIGRHWHDLEIAEPTPIIRMTVSDGTWNMEPWTTVRRSATLLRLGGQPCGSVRHHGWHCGRRRVTIRDLLFTCREGKYQENYEVSVPRFKYKSPSSYLMQQPDPGLGHWGVTGDV